MAVLETNIQPSSPALVKARAVSGIKILTMRTLISIVLRIISSLVLAHLLFPRDYGLFAVVSYITGLGMFLCDVGLSSALVRQSHAPTKDESVTVFWCQQIFTTLASATIILSAPWMVHLYGLSSAAHLLIVSMSLGLFFSSLRIVPMMALERDLQFPTIARCELTENVVQTISTIALASLHWGAWALVGGCLLRGAVGLICVWAASPWRPEGKFQFAIVKRLAAFGFAFQLNAIVPSLVSGWAPMIVGRILGVAAVGLVGWATNIASVPLMLSGIINRVAFPSYSRLQADPEALGRYLGSSIRRLGALFSLLCPLVVIACPVLIPLLFRARWAPAIPLVQWFSLECAVLTITGLLASTQNATGLAGERLAVTIGVGAMRWSVAYIVVRHFGLVGIGPSMFMISLSEMGLSSYLVRRRNSGCKRVTREVFEPIVIGGGLLAVSLAGGWAVASGHLLLQTTVSLFLFLLSVSLLEAFTRGRVFLKEIHALTMMMRPTEQKA